MRLSNRCYAVTGSETDALVRQRGIHRRRGSDAGGGYRREWAGGPDHSRLRFGGETGEPAAGGQHREAFRSHRRKRLLFARRGSTCGAKSGWRARLPSSRRRSPDSTPPFPTRRAANAVKPALSSVARTWPRTAKFIRTPLSIWAAAWPRSCSLPGTPPANLAVWSPEDGVLFTGDCLVSEYLPNLDAGTRADWQLWLASLDRIEALRPAIVVPGHGPVVLGAGIRTVVDAVRSVLRESIERGCSPTANRGA